MRKLFSGPVLWSSLIFAIALTVTFLSAPEVQTYTEATQTEIPETSLLPVVLYFLGMVAVIGVILFFIPVAKLKYVFRVVFALLLGWGVLIIVFLNLSFDIKLAVTAAVVFGALWFLVPLVWLHNLLLLTALAAVGAVFGFTFPTWTFILFMMIVAVYDFLAVRFGYMMWMAGRMSQIEALPAFVIPVKLKNWNLNLQKFGFRRLIEDRAAEREFSILGGGDIGFPLLLVVSVFSHYGLNEAIIVAVFSWLGLMSAYWIQAFFLKGKPMPALPPIAVVSVIGFLVVRFVV